jgi:hypothetical protein
MDSAVVLLKRLDGHPVLVVSKSVSAIDTCTDPTGLAVGCTIVLKNGREISVVGNVPDISEKLFPIWMT